MKQSTLRHLLVALGVVCCLLLVTAVTGYQLFFAPQFQPKQKVSLYINPDDSADSIYNKVKQLGQAKGMTGFRWLSRWRLYDQHLHTGHYLILPGDNAYTLFHRLYRGQQTPVNITIGSARSVNRIAKQLERQLMIDSTAIATALHDTLFLQNNGYTEETLMSLFIPNTYQVYWDITVERLLQRLVKEHNRFWNEERQAKAKAIGLTPQEVAMLASIVEEETNNNPEKKMVAGLYINRLQRGIPLQADPTVKFALQEFTLRRITNEHLKVESPYNTYLHQGLPPGPIRIPTPIGLDAVLNYTRHNYLYMCAKEDFSGTHNFATTLSEHNRNAQRYWNALNKRKIYR